MKRIIALTLVAGALAFGVSDAHAASTLKNLKGTFGFSFSGGSATGLGINARAAGTGILYADGAGNLTGTVNCNKADGDTAPEAASWQATFGNNGTNNSVYSVGADGSSGTMVWYLTNSGYFCGSNSDHIDFTFQIVSGGSEILFASMPDVDYDATVWNVVEGEAVATGVPGSHH